MVEDELKKLYLAHIGVPVREITELPSSGSNRRYFRLTGEKTLIGAERILPEDLYAMTINKKHHGT